MKKITLILATALTLLSINAYADEPCVNPNKKSPVLQDYFDLKLAQGFNNMQLIKDLDKKFCFDYKKNSDDIINQIFQIYTKEQKDFFFAKNPSFKDYKTPDTNVDLLMYSIGFPFMYLDNPTPELKAYIINTYKKYVPNATEDLFDQHIHNFWVNAEDFTKYPPRLKAFIDFSNSLLPYYNKADLNKKDPLGNNALHYAMMTKNSKPILYFQPTGLELLKKNDLGANLWHYAFLPAPSYLPKGYTDVELKAINKYLLDNFKPSYIRFMGLGNPLSTTYKQVYPFEYFAYKFKDNNPELYNSLKTKYPEVFNTPDEVLKDNDMNIPELTKYFNVLIMPKVSDASYRAKKMQNEHKN